MAQSSRQASRAFLETVAADWSEQAGIDHPGAGWIEYLADKLEDALEGIDRDHFESWCREMAEDAAADAELERRRGL